MRVREGSGRVRESASPKCEAGYLKMFTMFWKEIANFERCVEEGARRGRGCYELM